MATPTDMNSLSEYAGGKIKSFWERREGTTGMVILAVLAAALFMGWGVIVPFVLATLLNTFYAGILAVALAFVVATRGVWVSMFQSACRGLTRLWANIDPIGIMEEDLRQDKKELSALDKNMEDLSGQIEGLGRDQETAQDEYNEAMSLVKQANDKLKKSNLSSEEREVLQRQIMLNGNSAGRKQEYLKSLANLMATLQDLYRIAEKWRGHLEYLILDRADFIQTAKKRRKMSITGKNIVDRMKGILHVDPDRVYLLNAAIEAQADQYNARVGTIKNFVRTYRDTLTKGDLQNEANAQMALRQLEEWERQQSADVLKNLETRHTQTEMHPLAKEPVVAPVSNKNRENLFQ